MRTSLHRQLEQSSCQADRRGDMSLLSVVSPLSSDGCMSSKRVLCAPRKNWANDGQRDVHLEWFTAPAQMYTFN